MKRICMECPLGQYLLNESVRRLKDLEILERENAALREDIMFMHDHLMRVENRLKEQSRRLAHEISEQENRTQMIVNKVGVHFSNSQVSAIYTVLDRIASDAIESNDLDRLHSVKRALIAGDIEEDCITPIVRRIDYHIDLLTRSKDDDATAELNDKDKEIIGELTPIFKDNVSNARAFLNYVRSQTMPQITVRVNKEIELKRVYPGRCHKELYDILYSHGLYTRSQANWNDRLNVKK